MLILVSGEGSTDIGRMDGDRFEPGAMGYVLEQLLCPLIGYSPLESNAFVFVEKSELAKKGKTMVLRGKKREAGTALYFKNALALGTLAIEKERDEDSPVIAVLFRDADGTRTTSKKDWQGKWDSIVDGFRAAAYDRDWTRTYQLGVPMVPRPKSEVWILCGVKENSYQNCAGLESISGNDNSPKSAKKQLAAAIEHSDFKYDHQSDLVRFKEVDASMIDMPSFNIFRNRLKEVVELVLNKPP